MSWGCCVLWGFFYGIVVLVSLFGNRVILNHFSYYAHSYVSHYNVRWGIAQVVEYLPVKVGII